MANIVNGTATGSGGLITTGDSSDELQLQTAETARITLTNTAVVVNEGGEDVDFRVEGDTDANLLFVDAGNDRIGVGIDTPQQVLDIASGGKIYLRRTDNTTGATISSDGPGNGLVCHELNGEPFIWKHSSELMRISADVTPYLRLASGTGGIQFGGDTAAANALDDYEEGFFTVTLTTSVSGTITVNSSINEMAYIKIGRQVTIFGRFNISSVSSPVGNVRMNLPFTNSNIGFPDQAAYMGLFIVPHAVNLSAGTLGMFGEVSPGGTFVNFNEIFDNAAWASLPAANLTGSGNEYFYVTGSYFAV